MQHRPTQTKMYASQLQYSSMMGSIWRSSSTDILRRLLCASSLLLLSFWSMPTMMPDTLGATIKGNSTRVASSSAKTSLAHSARYIVLAHSAKCIVTSEKPALHIPLSLSATSSVTSFFGYVCKDGLTKRVSAIYSPLMVQRAKFHVHPSSEHVNFASVHHAPYWTRRGLS